MMDRRSKRQQRQAQEDALFNRMLLWIGGAVVVELLLLLLKSAYVDMRFGVGVANGLLKFFEIYRFAGLLLALAGIVWLALAFRGRKSLVLPAAVTAALFGLWVTTTLAYQLFDDGLRILLALPAVAGVLILVYFLYQPTFFINTVLTCGGLAALWLQRHYFLNHPNFIRACFVGGLLLLAGSAVLTRMLDIGDGKLKGIRLTPDDMLYPAIYLTCILTGAAMLLSLLLGGAAPFYLMLFLFGWLFVQAVFFTVKLM